MVEKKIVVLGGGTAGWMTALFCRQTFASASVTVIENTALGTIGVGEGATQNLTVFLNSIGLCELDVMKESGGSIKTGISFENWNGDNKKYFHSFPSVDIFSMPPHFDSGCAKYHLQTLIKDGLDFNEHVYTSRLAYRNELDLYNIPVALHMDASKLGSYLRRIGSERNIVTVDGNFSHVETDENDFIQKLCLDDGRVFECDFVFDCSGFAKLLIGKHYQTGWTSYKDLLPMDKAVTFRLEAEEDVKPYTQAIAMEYGWMWKIAIQDCIGAGYVFDSDYLNEEDAVAEAEHILGRQLENVRSVPFESGTHDQFWVKNCIAVGLASNFIEPLEATSLDVVVAQLRTLRWSLSHIFKYDEKTVSAYNKTCEEMLEGITHFIYLHYLTKRNDTAFWSAFRKRHPVPENFQAILQAIHENNLTEGDVATSPFSVLDYLEIGNGLKLFQQPIDLDGYENLTPSIGEYKEWCNARISSPDVVSCSEFLREL